MLPPNDDAPALSSQASASDWLSENIAKLSAMVTESHFSAHPELVERYGFRGKQKCTEDTAYHLHYLAEAIAANSTQIFVDYIGWGKIMLSSRGIDASDLENNLLTISNVLGRQCAAYKELFESYIRIALGAFPSLPDVVPTFIKSSEPYSDVANSYLNSLLVLNRDEAIIGVLQKVKEGLTIKNLFQHVIYPVQQEVGRLWQQSKITVVQEHYCTAATHLLIAKLRRGFIGTLRQVSALAVCVQGEEHCLGLKMLSELLKSDGWKVTYMEAKPASDILNFLESKTTDLVALSVGTVMNLSKVRQLITAIKALPPKNMPRIIIGGRGITSDPNVWQRMGADAYSASMIDGLEEANRLVGIKI